MSVSQQDIKMLWGRAAGRCSNPDCGKELYLEDVVVGQMAHIIAQSPGGPRGSLPVAENEKDSYYNLVLLCYDCHKLVDDRPEKYPPETLIDMKNSHERQVRESWERATLAESEYEKQRDYIAIIHESLWPINEYSVLDALGFTPARLFRVSPVVRSDTWEVAANAQTMQWQEITNYLMEQPSQIAVFSLAHIPVALHFGFLITNRIPVHLFQYDRDAELWTTEGNTPNGWLDGIQIAHEPPVGTTNSGDCIIRLSISAPIDYRDCEAVVPGAVSSLHISAPDPSVSRLLGQREISEVGKVFRESVETMLREISDITSLHLFYAGPSHLSVHLGRQINSTMWPSIVTYNFNINDEPRYKAAITLEG